MHYQSLSARKPVLEPLIIEYVAVFEVPFGCPGFQDTALVCSRGVYAV